jgi:hypothetical protein
MLEATRPVFVFDYFRVPYRLVEGDGAWIRATGTGRRIGWPAGEEHLLPARLRSFDGVPVFARVLPDAAAARLLGRGWHPAEPVLGQGGTAVASLWRRDGDVFLPFDPGEAALGLWSEAYRDRGGRGVARTVALGAYYRLRPLVPRRLQIALRRGFSRVQERRSFPRWPAETALHDLYERLFSLVAAAAGEPIPYIAPWPGGASWALVLTHDVETADGCERVAAVADVERRAGLRSSWNFVPRRYDVDERLVAELRVDGFEIGVHGLYHDGRDLANERVLRERLPAMREAAARWGAVGFRSPATHRNWKLMPLLGFDYDSSYPDTDPYEPKPGGCCTWLPFANGELLELPITLLQDHTLFVVLGKTDESLWVEKAELLRDRGGMALVLTHPDYLDEERLAAYRRLLDRYAGDDTAWRALPRDVAGWWRRRAASSLVPDGAAWRVTGPAAGEASVAYAN